ncbi:MAG: 4-(cytidine 5'-diphospho)-2-C-methyl-D-erythritol kinase [Gammaproteobacteria bacterium]|nr:4-(cytidine 5'-diphospho)-2-C-methyl-D-erythritol kinase [Gammaproteobacteria bacterium]
MRTKVKQQSWPAPAKLNLCLRVTGRRGDGYHDLQTLFQILDWGDELRISVNDSGKISRNCNIEGIAEEDDICVKAARLLRQRHGVRSGAHIDLLKRIPMGAGLGGGSSDAATVLLVLNRLWSCGRTPLQLAELGLELGADVPVFIHGYSAWAEGRGEILHPVSLGSRYYVLIFPGLSISTAEVFGHPQLKRDSRPLDMSLAALEPGRNDCENVALQMFPELAELVEHLRSWGTPRMSGTGSTFFLTFDDKKTAIKAADELKCRYNIRAVGGVDRSHLLDSLSA